MTKTGGILITLCVYAGSSALADGPQPASSQAAASVCSNGRIKEVAEGFVRPLTATLVLKSDRPVFAGGHTVPPVPLNEANEYHGKGFEQASFLHTDDLTSSNSWIEVDRSLKSRLLVGLLGGTPGLPGQPDLCGAGQKSCDDVTGLIYSSSLDEKVAGSSKVQGLLFGAACVKRRGSLESLEFNGPVLRTFQPFTKPSSMDEATFEQLKAELSYSNVEYRVPDRLGQRMVKGEAPTVKECAWYRPHVENFIERNSSAHPTASRQVADELERVCQCPDDHRLNLYVEDDLATGKTRLRFHTGWFLERVTDKKNDVDVEVVAGVRDQARFNITTTFTEDILYSIDAAIPQLYMEKYDLRFEPPHFPRLGGDTLMEIREDCLNAASGSTEEVRKRIRDGDPCADTLRRALLLSDEIRYPGLWNQDLHEWEIDALGDCVVALGPRVHDNSSYFVHPDGFKHVSTGNIMRTSADVDREMAGCLGTLRAAAYRGALPRCFPSCEYTDLLTPPGVPPVIPRTMSIEQSLLLQGKLKNNDRNWPYLPYLNGRLQLRPVSSPVSVHAYYRYDLTGTAVHTEYWEEDPLEALVNTDIDVLLSPFGYNTARGAAIGLELESQPIGVGVQNIDSVADQLCDNLTGWVGVWLADSLGIIDCKGMILEQTTTLPRLLADELPWILSGTLLGFFTDDRERSIRNAFREAGGAAIDALADKGGLAPLFDADDAKQCLDKLIDNNSARCVFGEGQP